MDIKNFFEKHKKVVVAFSGGVDSAVLLHMAKLYAQEVYVAFVKSEFQPEFECNDVLNFCRTLNIKPDIINVKMCDNLNISINDENRCYYCKKLIFESIMQYYKNTELTFIEGTNASDDIDDRPGYKALTELGIVSPLKIYGYSKNDVRKYAYENDIFLWNKPSYSCLATRIPTGININTYLLKITESAENALFDLGFTDFRVRYLNGYAGIQLTDNDFEIAIKNRKEIVKALNNDYKGVFLDLKGR